ncbi:MAG: GIY-YIG nuclease family protein [Pseudomonadota bacterium]
MDERVWFVYLLRCRTGLIYTGVTPDLDRRMATHKAGRGARFTRMNPPEKLLAVKPFDGKIPAMQMEAQVKKLSKAFKLALADSWLKEYPLHHFAQELSAL